MANAPRRVFVVSDHTGITAENMARAQLAHFRGEHVEYQRRPFTDTVAKAAAVVREVAEAATRGPRPLLFSTIALPHVIEELQKADALYFDLLWPGIRQLETELGLTADHDAGSAHDITDNEAYLARMDALEFSLATDDGVGDRHYDRADLILVGVSRAGKTPTSLFLALQHGLKVSNYPLAEDDFEQSELPAPLRAHRTKLYGLTIDPRRLHAIRTARRPGSRYASLEQCEYEVRRAEALMGRHCITRRDTTTSSVEEIASSILSQLR